MMTTKHPENFFSHEDERRLLVEWVADAPFRSAKAIVAKSGNVIGDHYHNRKDEVFFLLAGRAKRVVVGDRQEFDVAAPRKWRVPKKVYHVFELEPGAVLLGAATEKFDPADEIRPDGSGDTGISAAEY